MVSYSVIVGSSLMTLSHPAVMIFRIWESENWILELPSRELVIGSEEVVFTSVLDGLNCADKNVVGTAHREIAQPRAWEWLSRIVD